MPYATGETPLPGDRIKDEKGRLGTVKIARNHPEDLDFGEITVTWDNGVIGMHFPSADEFALISRAFERN